MVDLFVCDCQLFVFVLRLLSVSGKKPATHSDNSQELTSCVAGPASDGSVDEGDLDQARDAGLGSHRGGRVRSAAVAAGACIACTAADPAGGARRVRARVRTRSTGTAVKAECSEAGRARCRAAGSALSACASAQ